MDIREQLAHLRRTVDTIDRKYAGLPSPPPAPPTSGFVEGLLAGELVETPFGKHFETERLYARHERHGSYDIADLNGFAPDLLEPLSAGLIRNPPPGTLAFLDTETTGLG